jgi:subtilisin-like proprotein convertase family protein
MRIVARLFVLLPLLWVEGVWAETCSRYSYIFESQAEIDALLNTACDEIRGNVIIDGKADIQNLDGLANITGIGGSLDIRNNPALKNLDGLANLSSVVSGIVIYNNLNLQNIDGLRSLTAVEGRLYLGNLDSITNLDGLSKLSSVGGRLTIAGNDALRNIDGLLNLSTLGSVDIAGNQNPAFTNVDGLSSLTATEGTLQIVNNRYIDNLDGLSNVIAVGGNLSVEGNAHTSLLGLNSLQSIGGNLWINPSALATLDGLESLTVIWGDLVLYQSRLINVDGLKNLERIGGYLKINRNSKLENLNGLSKLSAVGEWLDIDYNRNLSDCRGVAPVLGWPDGAPNDKVEGEIAVLQNSAGCNSIDEILASVSSPTSPVITGGEAFGAGFSLTFTPASTTDTTFPILGYRASCTGADIDVSMTPAINLFDNEPVEATLAVSGYGRAPALASIEVSLDITHSDPTDLTVTLTTPEGTEVWLWDRGDTGGEDLVGTFPSTLTPIDEGFYDIAAQTMDGNWVLKVEDVDVGPLVREGVLNSWGLRIVEEVSVDGLGSPVQVTGIARGRDYQCTVSPITHLGTIPMSEPFTISVPYELPVAPLVTKADYEDGSISLTVSVSDDGGTHITSYTARCTDGTNTFTGTSTSSPITVSGLTNDVAYTCTVTATNSVGTSSASAATAPIIPEESTTGLPVWLLYQATQ